jgi:PQQ-dependent catabolism-associated beta-propeller protein
MRVSILALVIASTMLAGPTVGSVRVYVSNERSGDVTVIDAASRKPIATLPVGKRPRGIRVSPDGTKLFVALSGSPITPPGQEESDVPADKKADGIGVVDLASHKLERILPGGSDPEQFDFSRDGKKLYVANEDANAVSVVDTAAGKVLKTLKVGTEPEGVTTSPDGTRVFVTSESTNEVHVIDTATASVVGTIKTDQRPRAVAFTPDGKKAYVTCESGGTVCVVDTRANLITKRIHPPGKNPPAKNPGEKTSAPRPMGMALSPNGTRLYVTTGRGGSVVAIDTTTDEITATADNVAPRPWGIGVTADGRTLFTADGPSNDVTVLDAATLEVETKIPAGQSPWGIAVAP